jgi:hypothetical protein
MLSRYQIAVELHGGLIGEVRVGFVAGSSAEFNLAQRILLGDLFGVGADNFHSSISLIL